jgi:hypothetical protein
MLAALGASVKDNKSPVSYCHYKKIPIPKSTLNDPRENHGLGFEKIRGSLDDGVVS